MSRSNLQASETDRRCKRVLVVYELLMPRYTGFLTNWAELLKAWLALTIG